MASSMGVTLIAIEQRVFCVELSQLHQLAIIADQLHPQESIGFDPFSAEASTSHSAVRGYYQFIVLE